MDDLTVDQVIAQLTLRLRLSKETETEVLAEIRTHLEDAVADAEQQGKDGQEALLKAAERFGLAEVGSQLHEIHANRETIDAIAATALPVLLTIFLRWLVFFPSGSAVEWRQQLTQPGFLIIAGVILAFSVLFFRRWRYVLVVWGLYWVLTLAFVLYPNISHW